MNYARTRRGLVVLVTLLLGLSLVAPAAVAVGPHDDGEDGFGDGLSSDSDSESGDSLFSDSDSDSGSGSDSDSSGDTTTSGGDSSSDTSSSDTPSSDSDSSDSFGSDDDTDSSDSSDSFGSDDDTDSSDSSDSFGSEDDSDEEILPNEDDDTLLRQSLPTLVSDSTTASLDSGTVSETDLVDVDATSSTSGTTYEVELIELTASDDPILRLTATGGTTDGVATTLTTVSDALSDTGDRLTVGTSGTTDATAEAARVESTEPRDPVAPVDDDTAAIEPRAADADTDGGGDTGATRRNAIGFDAPISSEDIPGGPGGAGAMVGLLGAAAAVAARQSGALSGMTGSLETTARTTAAAMPGSSYLDRLVRMLAPFRYSRYDDSDPLEHDAREAMFEVVEDSPGTYLSEIADRADIPLSTARHHIRVLEREDLVSGAKVRGKRRFYPAHTEGVELAAAMNDDSTAAVIDALARLGAASVSDLADELGKDPSTVTHHVQRLEEDEVVVRERDGRAVMNKLTAAARTMLEPDERRAESPAAGEAMASD